PNGRPSGRRPRRGGPGTQHARPSGPQTPALEPTVCETAPVPFASLGLDARLLEGIRDLGFTETRPIQTAVIQLALGGSDLIACAETGSGKTCAFVVPILQRLLTLPPAVIASNGQAPGAATDTAAAP